MANSDERREVAREMREVTDRDYAVLFIEEILEGILGGCRNDEGRISDKKILARLADLIDPTCEVVSEETFFGSFGCEEAGTIFALSCGHETIVDGDYPPNYCPECGKRVVSNDDQ